MKRNIYLEGELGDRYGHKLVMEVNSFAEVVNCLQANYPDVKKYFIDSQKNGINFVCEVEGEKLGSKEELLLHYKTGDMRISPTPSGSKGGLKVILGAWLIYAGYVIAGPIGAAVAAYGIGFIVEGIQDFLAPDPSNDADNDSYLFEGSGQTVREGDPVPVLYGKLRIPGRPISFQVRNENISFYDSGTYQVNSPDTNNENDPRNNVPIDDDWDERDEDQQQFREE